MRLETIVSEEFKTMDERMIAMDAKLANTVSKLNNIENRLIDVEQKQIAQDVQIESRFYSIEVILEKLADQLSGKKQTQGKTMAKGRGKN
ncbi:hypothetical protein [Chitinophaga agri]|uniref:Uncharacterized protein n=1 Tax=Chitinophaga agri TaxID=2703787 RepID=A0A6B9Z8Q0_9BACT|nr:hypothetical protein [Chitinophaga agri]QHS58622.1 hypothetical protein GWR21_03115 [Chitinophaga agri]